MEGNYNTRKTNHMSARCFFFHTLLSFFHHRIKICLLLHSAYHKTFADYFIWKNLSSHWNLTGQKDVHTVGQLPLADKLWFTIWSRLHLIQEKSTFFFANQKFKAIVNCNHNTFDVLKNCHAGNQRRDVAWQLSRNWNAIHLFGRSTPKSILKETAKYGLRFFLLRCGYQYQHFSFGTVSWRYWESLILVCLKLFVRQCQENPSDDPGKHSHEPALHIGDSVIGINDFLNILGVHIDDKLSFNHQPLTFVKKVYAKLWDDLESWCLLTSQLCCTRLIYFHTLNIVGHYH